MRAILAIVLSAGILTACSTAAPPPQSTPAQLPPDAIAINDKSAVPYIDYKRRDGYSSFLRLNLHRAFAISSDSSWAYYAGRPTQDYAIQQALIACQRHSSVPCEIYAVDVCVVWRDNRCSLGDAKRAESADKAGDYPTAFAEYLALAEAGNSRAQLYVAESYELDRGIANSRSRSYQWYVKAGENGQPHGWYRAGMMAHSRKFNGETFYDPDKGREFVRKAAEQGNAEAQFRLGEWYRLGVDSSVDMSEALKWYRLAAAQGHRGSQDALRGYFSEP